MNGYRARVQRHRQQLAEAAAQGERIAVPHIDPVTAAVEGIAEAAAALRRHGHAATADDKGRSPAEPRR